MDEAGNPALKIWKESGGEIYRFCWTDGMEFRVRRDGRRAWACGQDQRSLEDIGGYFLGPVMGFLLKLRGVTCLHASAIAIGNSCVAFAGVEGAGKSTIAAAFARRGFSVLSDDIVAIVERERRFHVPAAQPYVCLWPEAVEILFGTRNALPAPSVDGDKHHFPTIHQQGDGEAITRPLAAIYFLGERGTAEDLPRFTPLAPQEAFLELVANTYANRLVDEDMRAREFKLLGRVVASVPTRKLFPDEDPARLSQLCDAVLKDVESRAKAASAAAGNFWA